MAQRSVHALCCVLLVWPSIALAEASLTPTELVDLVLAGRQQYRTISVEEKVEWNDPPPNGKSITSVVWRGNGTRSYMKTTLSESEGNAGQESRSVTSVFGRNWAKRLVTHGQNNTFRGAIFRPDAVSRSQWLPYNLWEPIGDLWSRITDENTGIHQDERTGVYTLTYRGEGGWATTISVDPAMGYFPLSFETTKPDGEVVSRAVNESFRQMEGGLWFPFKYTFDAPGASLGARHTVLRADVNIDIPDEDLNLEFPPDTVVDDHIANLSYVVGKLDDDKPILSIDDPKVGIAEEYPDISIVHPDDVDVAPATQEELQAAARRGDELLASHDVPQAGVPVLYYAVLGFVALAAAVTARMVMAKHRRRS